MATGNQGQSRRTTKWVQVTEGDDDQSDSDPSIWIVEGQAGQPFDSYLGAYWAGRSHGGGHCSSCLTHG